MTNSSSSTSPHLSSRILSLNLGKCFLLFSSSTLPHLHYTTQVPYISPHSDNYTISQLTSCPMFPAVGNCIRFIFLLSSILAISVFNVLGTELCPPKIQMLKPFPPMCWFMDLGFWEAGITLDHEGGDFMIGLVPIYKNRHQSSLSLPCEDPASRWLSARQEKNLNQNPTQLVSQSQTSSL